MKTFNENYWEVKSGKNTVSISRNDDGSPAVSWTGPNRKHGICQPDDEKSYAPAKKIGECWPVFLLCGGE